MYSVSPLSRFLWTGWPLILIWIKSAHYVRLGFTAVKPVIMGFILELSDLIFGLQLSVLLPCVLLQELTNEALGQLACIAKELFVKLVVHPRDVSQRFLLRVPEER